MMIMLNKLISSAEGRSKPLTQRIKVTNPVNGRKVAVKSIRINAHGFKIKFENGHYDYQYLPNHGICTYHHLPYYKSCPDCDYEDKMLAKDEEYWDSSSDYGSQDLDDPCFDCDDTKVPYAARHCDTCKHGGCKRQEPLTDEEFKRLNDDDGSAYEYDMWGPDAVRRRRV